MKGFRFSFRTKTILILLFFGIVPLLLNGLLTISNLENSLKKKTIQNLEEMSRLVAVQIENFITEAFDNVLSLFRTPTFTASEVSLETKIAEIKKIASYYPIFQDIALLDKDGRVLFSSSFKFYGKWANNFWFLEAKKRKEITMSDIYAVTDPSQPILAFFLPIMDEKGEINLFVAAQLNMERFLEIISSVKIGERGQAFLINSRGDIIAHQYKSLFFEKISPDYPLKEATSLKEGEVEFTFRQEKMLGTFRVIENFQQHPGKNWHLILVQPKEEVFSPVRQIRNQIYLFLLFLSLTIFFIAYFLGGYITQPLEKFAKTAREVSAGNLRVQVEIKTKDEFGDLAVTFNQMINDLRRLYSKLEDAKRNLEKEVKARTEELEILAKNLDAEVKRRTEELQMKIEELNRSRVALINILEDVEEARKKAEEERDKTNALIVNFADGLLVFDKENRLSLINPQAEKFFNVKSQDLIGKSVLAMNIFSNLQPLVNLLSPKIKEVFRKELPIHEELILEVTTVPIIIGEEKLGTLVVLHDITREKIVEKLKTEFVSLSAHQLRTPLSAIKWTLRMLLDGDLGPISREQKEFIEKTYRSNERMIGLINDLLNVTRIEEGRYLYKPTLTSLESLVDSVIESYKGEIERRKINFEFRKPKTPLPQVLVDVEKMKLAIQNLLDNAIRYTPTQGRVIISLKGSKNEIEFSIKDTGIGIPKDQQFRVFTKFFRAPNATRIDTEGTGLGLFITKNIIEAHEGKTWFESKEGKGTTFYFTLPIKGS